MEEMEYLFSYGTLQQETVQMETFGRILRGEKEVLSGYVVGQVRIRDQNVISASGKAIHPILRKTGRIEDEVTGTVFPITSEELAQADTYEVEEYRRIAEQLKSGKSAWIYVAAMPPDEKPQP